MPLRLRELLHRGRTRLLEPDSAARDTPELDARVLLEFLFHFSRAELLTRMENRVDETEIANYDALLERRAGGEPVAYLTGSKEFCGLDFEVGEGVLVPRPETETLVEAALEEWKHADRLRPFRVADICTGSGCVAVSLLHLGRQLGLDGSGVVAEATDLSSVAASTAERNAVRLLGAGRLRVVVGDLMSPLSGSWDLVVSNPPYLTPEETEERVESLRWQEPALALDGGGIDGLDLIRRLAGQAFKALNPNGLFLVEASPRQREIVGLLKNVGFWELKILTDLAGLDRVYCGRKTL